MSNSKRDSGEAALKELERLDALIDKYDDESDVAIFGDVHLVNFMNKGFECAVKDYLLEYQYIINLMNRKINELQVRLEKLES